MPDPKYVIAMGACVIGGGPYSRFGYHVVQGVDLIVPVDVYLPGCPPRPEALIDALRKLQFRIQERTGESLGALRAKAAPPRTAAHQNDSGTA